MSVDEYTQAEGTETEQAEEQKPQFDAETEGLLGQVKQVSAEIRTADEKRRDREQLVRQLLDKGVEGKHIHGATGLSWAAWNRVREAAVKLQS